ncbi:telomerase RNA component interacting RNase-like [Myxocyprinus asiaticus]|uniref:telomerase RNA component interacting RNase-like n=1 Tax=Myxocyprinus asiaticus TaxID=70543 RepID=UPI002223330E|nr:telomerase RNA component interacting RNase-like [Myxocyprinus asiaticus]
MDKKQHKSDKQYHHRRRRHHHQTSSSSSSGESGGSSPAHGAPKAANAFANDGSFMEMFKKKMEEEERRKRETEEEEKSPEQAGQAPQDKKPFNVTSFVGKRRGGARLALKTGMVAKKQKLDSEVEAGKGDAWTKYMAEVKKYKAHQCGDDDKTRPLVK